MKFLLRTSVVVFTVFLSACLHEDKPAPTTAPTTVTTVPGENLVVLDWDVVSGLTYWIFYKQGTSVSLEDYDNIIVAGSSSPYLVTGLENGIQYAFSMTSSNDGSKVGPFSPVITSTPRLLSPAIPWVTSLSLGIAADLRSVAFGFNTYVTVGTAATIYVAPYSYADIGGVTGWSAATTLPVGLTVATDLTSVVHDGSRFLALGDDGYVITSTDGQTWEDAEAIPGPPPIAMNALAVGAGAYVAVGNGGQIYTNTTPGATDVWDLKLDIVEELYDVSYVNGLFIAVGEAGKLLISADAGVSWVVPTTKPVTAETLRQVAYGADTFVAVGDAGTVWSSTDVDADVWVEQADPTDPPGQNLNAIAFGPDKQFIIVGDAGRLVYSITGAEGTWDATATAGTATLNDIVPSVVFQAVGNSGAIVSGK